MTTYYKDGFFDDADGGFVPESAVEISQDKYIELLNGQSQGKQIIADKTGYPVLIEPAPTAYHELKDGKWVISASNQTALLAEKREQLIVSIDDKATAIYRLWTRFESEYKARKDAAEQFKNGGYKGEPSVYITSFAIPAGLDNKSATDIILQQAAGLQKLQDHLAALRMRKYNLKHPGLTIEQMQSIHDEIVNEMNGLVEAYNNG